MGGRHVRRARHNRRGASHGQERPPAVRLSPCRPPTAEVRAAMALVADDGLAALFSRVLCPAVTLFAPLSTRASSSAGLMSVAGVSFSGACRLFSVRAASHLFRLALYSSSSLMASQSGRRTKK